MKLSPAANKNYFLLVPFFIFIGCNTSSVPKEIFLNVSNPRLIYLGEIEDKGGLEIKWANDTVKFSVRTIFIMENDTLEAVKVSVTDDNLKLKILTQPYENPYWYDIDKLTKVHDVEFDITGLKKGRYNLNLQINNTFTHRGDFSIN